MAAGNGDGKEQNSNQHKAFGRWGRRWWMQLLAVFPKPSPFLIQLLNPNKKKWSETKEGNRHGPKTGQSEGREPLSVSLQNGLRFFQPPLPPVSSVGLATVLPKGKTWGLPCSACLPEWVRSQLLRRRYNICDRHSLSTCSWPRTLRPCSGQALLVQAFCLATTAPYACSNSRTLTTIHICSPCHATLTP